MKTIDISDFNHPLYNNFETLYSGSFPIFEQRTRKQQDNAFKNPHYHLTGFEDKGVFIGFISYWAFDTYIYIEHFAVNSDLRGQGYGSAILRQFTDATDKIILLEIDPVIDNVSLARLRFYKHCGFHENPFPHKHPAYRDGFTPHSLVVLSSGRIISEKEYISFGADLDNIIMRGDTL